MDKAVIRREVLRWRNALDSDTRKIASIKLAERIIGHQWFYKSDTILAYAGYGSEIDTAEIIKEALRTAKKVYLPRVEGEQMNFYRIWSIGDLRPGYKGIPEPSVVNALNEEDVSERYVYDPSQMEHTLMIMPGVAFDPYRNRLGYGKGFYDKYLLDKDQLQLRTIAVGFQCQAVDEIPADENDRKPYQVILV